MSLLNNSNAIPTTGGDYNLENSLRFRSSASAYLSRTPATAGNRKTWTFSCWVKRALLGDDITNYQNIIGAQSSNVNNTPWTAIQIDQTNRVRIFYEDLGVTSNFQVITNPRLRDPSSWYHIVVQLDTTQATDSDRIKIYINGEHQTSLFYTNYPTLNEESSFNNNVEHLISYYKFQALNVYSDQYVTEVNFVDGQALTASDFGEYNEDTGVWQPIKYTGTYGTNGFYLPFENKSAATYINTFNGSSQSLSVVGSADMALGTGDCTVECYFKVDSLVNYRSIIDNRDAGASSAGFSIDVDVNGSIYNYSNGFIVQSANGTISAGQYYHVAYTRASGTHRLFVDGVQVATSTTARDYTNDDIFIGRAPYGGEWFDGEISNVRIVKGTAVYTSNFTPAITNLTAVTNTKLLTCQSSTIVDNSGLSQTIVNEGTVAASLGNPFRGISVTSDQSGNINNWVSNNINLDSSTATTYDIMTDVPTLTDEDTANYAVMNPLNVSSDLSITQANLLVSKSTNATRALFSTIGASSGKFYWEVTWNSVGANDAATTGIAIPTYSNTGGIGGSGSIGYLQDGRVQANGTVSTYGDRVVANDIIGVALDLDAGTLVFYNNNVSQGTAATGITGEYMAACSMYNSGDGFYINFGQRPFTYTPPTGYKKLNTFNLPDSSIEDGSEYFNTVTYAGSDTTQSITGVGFSPNLVWMKNRTSAANNILMDTIRGGTKFVESNTTAAETTVSGLLTFDTDGFSPLGGAFGINAAGSNYVSWNWKAGDTAVSNTDGTITSQVSANPTAGFSIATYTGTGNIDTVGHGLNVQPDILIVKTRTQAQGWIVYTKLIDGSNDALFLNTTDAAGDSGFSGATPTVFDFNLGASIWSNTAGRDYVMYSFASVEGYSKMGTYIGNGSADGVFVYTGFRPAFVLSKCSSTGGSGYSWNMTDTSRFNINPAENLVWADSSAAESTTNNYDVDILSNGFKLRGNSNTMNQSGSTYIYMAFAENPMKHSLAR